MRVKTKTFNIVLKGKEIKGTFTKGQFGKRVKAIIGGKSEWKDVADGIWSGKGEQTA